MASDMPVARDLGIPVKGVSWVRLHAGETADGKPSLLVTMTLAAVVASNTGVGAYESARMNSSAEARVQRAMNRITRDLMPCGCSDQ